MRKYAVSTIKAIIVMSMIALGTPLVVLGVACNLARSAFNFGMTEATEEFMRWLDK